MINTIFQFILSFLSQAWLKNLLPAKYQVYLTKFDKIAPFITEAIALADGTDLDNAGKKRHASEFLLLKLQENNIDIPGDHDMEVCESLVEAMYGGLKKLLPSSAK